MAGAQRRKDSANECASAGRKDMLALRLSSQAACNRPVRCKSPSQELGGNRKVSKIEHTPIFEALRLVTFDARHNKYDHADFFTKANTGAGS